MSRSFVGALVRGERAFELRYVIALQEFLGHEQYHTALELARNSIADDEQRYMAQRKRHQEAREKAQADLINGLTDPSTAGSE